MAKKLKSIPADKISLSNISELTDAVIKIADRQDKFEDSILKLSHKQERLQDTFDNLVGVLTTNIDTKLNNHSIKTAQFSIDKADSIQRSLNDDIKFLKQDISKDMNELRTSVNDSLDLIADINIPQAIDNTQHLDILSRLNKFNSLTFFERLFSKI